MASGFRTYFISEYILYLLVISSDAVLTTVYNCLLSPWVCWFLLLSYLGLLSLHCSGNLLPCSYQFHLFQEVDYLYPWMPFFFRPELEYPALDVALPPEFSTRKMNLQK